RAQERAAERHDAIAALHANAALVHALSGRLRRTIDVERVVSRIALRNARPRDLAGLRDTLAVLPGIASMIGGIDAPLLREVLQGLQCDARWHALLGRAVAPEPSAQLRDGGVIAAGYDAELDELRAIDAGCATFLVELERRERDR